MLDAGSLPVRHDASGKRGDSARQELGCQFANKRWIIGPVHGSFVRHVSQHHVRVSREVFVDEELPFFGCSVGREIAPRVTGVYRRVHPQERKVRI